MNCLAFIKGNKCLSDSDLQNIKNNPAEYLNMDLLINIQQKLNINASSINSLSRCIQNATSFSGIETCGLSFLSENKTISDIIAKCGDDSKCFITSLTALDPSLVKDMVECYKCGPLTNSSCYACSSKKLYYIIGAVVLVMLILLIVGGIIMFKKSN